MNKAINPLFFHNSSIAKNHVPPFRAEALKIELAWDRGNVDLMNRYFGYTINVERGKPTNSEFIAMISDRLRMGERLA